MKVKSNVCRVLINDQGRVYRKNRKTNTEAFWIMDLEASGENNINGNAEKLRIF